MLNWIRGIFSRHSSVSRNSNLTAERNDSDSSPVRRVTGVRNIPDTSGIRSRNLHLSVQINGDSAEGMQLESNSNITLHIIHEGEIWIAEFNHLISFSELQNLALAHFFYPKNYHKLSSKYKLISLSKNDVLPQESIIYKYLTNNDKILLVAKKQIGFPKPGGLTSQDVKGPSKDEITAATAHLKKQNSVLLVPSFDCQESFQSEIRQVLYSLVVASAKVLALSPDAKVVFDGIAARINAKNKKEIDKSAVKNLKDLGFTEVQARYALRLKRNRQVEAMEWLLENSHRVKEEALENTEEASTSTLDTSSSITTDNPIHTINQLLRDIRDFHYRHFEPSPKALDSLQDMGFNQDSVIEALRVTGNNPVAACEWLCGERDAKLTQPEAGLDTQGPLYKALMNNPAIQLGLHNPKILLAFLSILENPTSANLWLNDVDTAPVLAQVFKTYHSEKHIKMVNQQVESVTLQRHTRPSTVP